MIILENTKEYKDTKLTLPVGVGVVQTEAVKNFYNTSDADATSADIAKDKTAYGKYGKLTGTLDLDAEKEISYQDGYETGKTDGYDSGYSIGYEGGYNAGETAGYSDGYAEGLDDGIIDGRNQIIEEQSDANITANDVTKGKIGYGANNEKIVGTSEAITSIDVAASGIKFGYSSFSEIPSYYDFNNVTNVYRMFYNCQNLTSVPLFNTSKVTNMDYMFTECRSLTTVPLFNTSNVTYMNNMFNNCYTLTSVPQFNTSNVTGMASMFQNCSKLTSVPQFNTSKVINMNNMFNNCDSLTSVPQFDTSNVNNISSMFNDCDVLTAIPELNCQSVTSAFNYNFYAPLAGCPKLESFGGFKDLGKTFTGSSSKTFYMGTNNQALTHESMINTFNGLYDLTTTSYTGTATFFVSKYPYDKLTEDDIAIATVKGWVISRYNG